VDGRVRARVVAAVFAGLVAASDLVQVVVVPWKPKHWGAVGGIALYALLAVGAARGWRPALVLAVAMPLVPLTVLALWAAGVGLPVAPDAAMVGILAFQVGAATASAVALRS
jgi:hypothetical protein